MGVVGPVGGSVASFWKGLLAGQSGVVKLEGEDFAGLPSMIGARATGYRVETHFKRKEARRLSRASQFALVAAEQAVAEAGLLEAGIARENVGVIIGSSIGGFSASDPVFRDYYTRGKQSAIIIPLSMNSGPSSNVSIRYGFKGPIINVDAACASSAHSIGYAFNLIRFGILDIAITGGADSPFSRGVVQAWGNLHALSTRNEAPATACRPFCADRDGMVLGEGAGALVIESEESARRRGAQILAEIKGYAATGDATHITQPSIEGPARAMQKALEDAGLSPTEIDYVNAHGTGTLLNDGNETKAIRRVFGDHAARIPIVSIKAAIGHSIGASGALELISCILSLRDNVVPPTINYSIPDPECDLDYVAEGQRAVRVRNAMSNSFAFGGSNAALVVGEID